MSNIGRLLEDRGQNNEVLAYSQQALQIAEDLGDFNNQTNALRTIGLIYEDIERVKEALMYFQQAHKIYKQLGEPYGKALCMMAISRILEEKRRIKKALRYYQKALRIAKELKACNVVKFIRKKINNLQRKQKRRKTAQSP